jgi:hypothetical protein
MFMKFHSIDRRLVKRVLTHWQNIACEGRIPTRAEMGPDTMGDDWAHCFVVDLAPELKQSRLAYIGANLQDPNRPSLAGKPVADCDEESIIRLAASRIPSVLKRRAPINFGGYAPQATGPILYRSIVLPLAEDGKTIDGVLAALNYRDAAADRGLHTDPVALAV